MIREDEIQARLDAATPGPWKTTNYFWVDYVVFGPIRELVAACNSAQNTNLIFNAPDDLAYLLKKNAEKDAEIERLEMALKSRHTSKCAFNQWDSHGGGYMYNTNARCICYREEYPQEPSDDQRG